MKSIIWIQGFQFLKDKSILFFIKIYQFKIFQTKQLLSSQIQLFILFLFRIILLMKYMFVLNCIFFLSYSEHLCVHLNTIYMTSMEGHAYLCSLPIFLNLSFFLIISSDFLNVLDITLYQYMFVNTI